MENFNTISELVAFQANKFNNPHALNFRENDRLKSFSNHDFHEKIFQFACGLKEIGLGKSQTVANFSYQNPIWLIVDLGSILAGAVTVPIFHNIAPENLFYEIEDAAVSYFFTDNPEIAAVINKKNPSLKIITYGFKQENSISFEELILLGQTAISAKKYQFESLLKISQPQDLATIIYTSGSTGRPKGVELTHLNLASQIKATQQFFPLTTSDVALSFLPLAHIFERMVMMFYITQGISVYFADDIKNVGNLLREFRPTLMTTVPRLLEKVFIKIRDGIEEGSFLKKCLGRKALERALIKDPQSPKTLSDKVFDFLVYRKFRAGLGGNMKMIICGGSALMEDLQRFYNNIGINLFCGYGLTETSPVIAANRPGFNKIGTVGQRFPDIEIKIADDKELLVRGPNVMNGYHNQSQKTAETIVDGWLKTGDLAEIDAEKFIKIIGRKKESFKNSNGKYINPIPIEQKLVQELGFLLGALIIAEGHSFTCALLFPEFEVLQKFKKKFAFSGSDEEFLRSEKLQNFAAKKIESINSHLDHWEQIRKFEIITTPISIESDDITPSMKLKRNVLEKKFAKVVEGFYL